MRCRTFPVITRVFPEPGLVRISGIRELVMVVTWVELRGGRQFRGGSILCNTVRKRFSYNPGVIIQAIAFNYKG